MEPKDKNIKKDWTSEPIRPPREKPGNRGSKRNPRKGNENYSGGFEFLPDRPEYIRILYVDPDRHNLRILDGYRLIAKYTITTARDFAEAQQKLTETNPHLILISASAAQSDSIAPFKKRMNYVPILILGRPQKDQLPRVSGGHGYLRNPIDVYQLDRFLCALLKNASTSFQECRVADRRIERERRNLARDRRQAESAHRRKSEMPLLKALCEDVCHIDDRSKQVTINGREFNLTRKEYDLFRLLASDVGRVFSNEQIVAHIWGENSQATCSDVYQYIHLLRQKIEDDPKHPRWLLTISGFGYKIAVEKE